MLARCTMFAVLTSVAGAQTFVVDWANGPGTNFTDIVSAVAAVPDGAVLIVRAGTYWPFTIANKGLSVLCDSGVEIVSLTTPVTISGTSLQQTVELRGMLIDYGLVLTGCQGPVLLYDCTMSSN